jgi:hypothetical protein
VAAEQLLSLFFIEGVVSRITSTIHGFTSPGDAVAVAFTVSVLTPNIFIKYVDSFADAVTCTAFAGRLLLVQSCPAGIIIFAQNTAGVGEVIVPKPEVL